MKIFIDTNIPMYAAGRDHPAKEPSIEILRKVATGEIEGVTDAEVFQEILHRFSAVNRLDQGTILFSHFDKVVSEVFPIEFQDVAAAKELLQASPQINARDAIHVSIMRRYRISALYSFDKHFDQIDDVERREPK